MTQQAKTTKSGMRRCLFLHILSTLLNLHFSSATWASVHGDDSAKSHHKATETAWGRATQNAPNILLIIADDLNLRLGCYGEPIARTPSLDQLAQESVLFTKAYAASTVCTPSRKSILTGLAIHKVGANNEDFMEKHPDTMTMPRWFREHGYQTVRLGKIEHGPEYAGPKDWDLSLTTNVPRRGKGKNYVDSQGQTLGNAIAYPDDSFTHDQLRANKFKEFVEQKRDKDRPFFFALGFHSPHIPWESQARHKAMFPLDQLPLPLAPKGATPMTKPPEYQKKMLAELHHPLPGQEGNPWTGDNPKDYNLLVPEQTQREMIREYYAAVAMMDEALGHIMATLKAQGLDKNTIVVFTSDQGYFLGYRGIWRKHYLYPEVLNVPLMVRYPGLQHAGANAAGIVELLDLFPTLSDLAGITPPEDIDGKSFVPQLQNPQAPGKKAAYAQGIMYGGRAVITNEALYLNWVEGPAVVRAAGGMVQGKSLAALDHIIDLTRLKDSVTIRLDGHQRWIDIVGHLEASREFYKISQDPQAWFDVSSDLENQSEIARHELLEQNYFPVSGK